MIQSNELASITVLVPFRRAGHAVSQEIVPFKIYEDEDWIKAVPQIPGTDRMQAGLPEQLLFGINDQKIVLKEAVNAEMSEIVRNIVQELRMQRLIS